MSIKLKSGREDTVEPYLAMTASWQLKTLELERYKKKTLWDKSERFQEKSLRQISF